MHFPNCMDISTPTDIEPGMGATLIFYSDRHAYTISRISGTGKTLWMKRDKRKRSDTNGMSDSQSYTYTPQPDAPEVQVKLTKDGWRSKGQKVWVGVRDEHFDYSF